MKKFFYSIIGLILVASCSSDSNDSKEQIPSSISVGYNESVNFSGEKELKIDNDFIATISQGIINGKHVGTTEAVYDSNKRIKIEVTPTIKYIPFPSEEWGSSFDDVKRTFEKEISGNYTCESTFENNVLVETVKDSKGYVIYIYMFTFKNQLLATSCVLTPVSEVKTLVDWLEQKYFLAPYSSSTSDITAVGGNNYEANLMTIGVSIATKTLNSSQHKLSTNYWYMTLIFPYTSTKSSDQEFEEIAISTLDNLFCE